MSNATDLVDAAWAFLPHLFRQQTLAIYGLVLLALVPAGLLWSELDKRNVDGESVAAKPTRFLLSLGVHAITLSWMFGFVRPDRMNAFVPMLALWMILISSTWELACILWQAARARQSHFNHSTPTDSAIYMSMGIFATLLVAANLPLAWAIVQWPAEDAEPTMMWAVLAGLLVTCFVGGGTGITIGLRNSHAVGRQGKRLPLFGWSVVAGDLRASHFLGIHALQAIPLLAGLAMLVSDRATVLLFAVAAISYGLLIGGTILQALRGRPVIRLDEPT